MVSDTENCILEVSRSGEPVKEYTLSDQLILGRSKECEIYLSDPSISRQHVLFKKIDQQFIVEKKSEFSPLILNGVPCSRSVLKNEDLLVVGPYQIKVRCADSNKNSNLKEQKNLVEDVTGPVLVETPQEPKNVDQLAIEEMAAERPMNELNAGPAHIELKDVSQVISIQENLESIVENNSSTKTNIVKNKNIEVKLILTKGNENFSEFVINKNEVYIGRDPECDLVLSDKKASKKNTLIHRVGMNFKIQDLNSTNGTYVNNKKISDYELSSDDFILIGDVELQFKAFNLDFLKDQKKVESLPEVHDSNKKEEEFKLEPVSNPNQNIILNNQLDLNVSSSENKNSEIAGLGGGVNKKSSLIEKYRKLPVYKQLMIIGVIIPLFYWLMQDDEIPKKKVKKNNVKAEKVVEEKKKGVSGLTDQQKEFIKVQYDLGFNYFKNHDYDRAIYELDKIFSIAPDYENAREIKRYALEGKQRLAAIEAERAKKEKETQLKEKIEHLIKECKNLMSHKQYLQATAMFTEILTVDPDNTLVGGWKKEIDAYNEKIKLKEEQKKIELEITKKANKVFQEGLDLQKKKKFYASSSVFNKVKDITSSDKKLLNSAKKMIQKNKFLIIEEKRPFIEKAKELEQKNEYVNAINAYREAVKVDPYDSSIVKSINTIKDILHLKAKAIYTEAVLAENYSDFESAKKKFQECSEVAQKDDIYYERSTRKLRHYFLKEAAANAN